MDYPFLNLVTGLALVFTESLSAGLTLLISRASISPAARRALFLILFLSLLPAIYVGFLFNQRMMPALNLQAGLGLLVIASLVAAFTALLSGIRLSSLALQVLGLCLVLSILFSLLLSFLLYRSLVPQTAVPPAA